MNDASTTETSTEESHLAEAGRILILLYGEAIEGLHAAAEAAEAGKFEPRLDGTVRASEAVCHLHLGLDLERGGEIAANLDQLYRFIQSQIPQINLGNDAPLARRLAGLLEPLLESWTEVVDGEFASATPALSHHGQAERAEPMRAGAL